MLDLETFLKTTPQNWKARSMRAIPEYTDYLDSLYPGIGLIEQVYLFEHKLRSRPKCARDGCTNLTKFHHYRYHKFCSRRCGHWTNSDNAEAIKENRRQTNLNRLGVENV